jgi:hypothetical protein
MIRDLPEKSYWTIKKAPVVVKKEVNSKKRRKATSLASNRIA